ncbi:hypothetical protein JCM17846_16190 [Iodidimonas nitroreducens]|uniref:Uncharacterized protein n=1 Tax=Iodidimonas nitroreducens TaxID=1236968 RepID=A0A5A7N7I6_9PROT|nr:hypothetical protein [Iodidimonas nitroreducens]GAK34356.1 hypothetical protein AQ1_02254 [alpha proteobacterium Q-1]GER03937.1 hypothetical protein JCM17846_16190 [Iodidimonas nitroreducens]
MIAFLLSKTAFDALFLPAAIAAAFIAFAPMRDKPHPAGIGLAIAFWMGVLMIRTLPIWPAVGGMGLTPYLGIAGLGIGLFADRPRFRLLACGFFVLLIPLITVLLIGPQEYGGRLRGGIWLIYPSLIAAGFLIFGRLVLMGPRLAAGRALFFASTALCVVAFLYGTRLGLHALSLSAAIAGTGLALWRLQMRWPYSASFAAGSLYFALAATLIFSRDMLALPVAISFLAFFVPSLALWAAKSKPAARLIFEIIAGSIIILSAGLVFTYPL